MDDRFAHDCDGESCSLCPACYRASGYEVCAYVCAHDNGYEKRCGRIDAYDAKCLLIAGHDAVCVSINEDGKEMWWT